MRLKKPHRTQLLLAALLAVPMLIGATSLSRKVYLERYQKIQNLSNEERSRLQRNFDAFRKLTPQAQQHWRDFHQNVTADPSLKSTMDDYFEWLNSLENPYDREALRKQSDVGKRAVMVNKMIIDHEAESRRRRFREQLRAVDSSFLRRLGSSGPVLPPEDLQAIFTHLESKLELSEFMASKLENLKNATDDPGNLKQNIFIISQLSDFKLGADGTWPSRKLVEEVVDQVDAPELKAIAKIPSDEVQRIEFARMIVRSMMAKELLARLKKIQPTDDELRDYFTKLPEDRRSRLLALPLEEQSQRLKSEYVARKLADEPRPYGSKDLQEFFRKLRIFSPPQNRNKWPQGGRGPNGRGPGGRERRPDKRDGDRPPPPRRDERFGERERRPNID